MHAELRNLSLLWYIIILRPPRITGWMKRETAKIWRDTNNTLALLDEGIGTLSNLQQGFSGKAQS